MTINFDDLEKLIRLAEQSDIEELEVVDGGQRIRIIGRPSTTGLLSGALTSDTSINATSNDADSSQNDAQIEGKQLDNDPANKPTNNPANKVPSGSNETTDSNNVTIDAPMMGTFYRRPEPSSDELVHKGDSVNVGDTLCVIEAMKIMHEVKAENAGVIADILVEEGDVVEFGQPLFVFK